MPVVGAGAVTPAAQFSPLDWPLIDYAICWAAGPNQTPAQDLWCSVTERTEGTTQVTRGKTYELDQVQPGEMTCTLRNDDGVFDPDNTASPWWPYVRPYRLMRLRAQYPATVNLLTADQATAFYASKGDYTGTALPQWVTQIGQQQLITDATVTISGVATVANRYEIAYPESAQGNQGIRVTGWSVIPGGTYTAQASAVWAAGIAAPLGYLSLVWYDAAGAEISRTTTVCTLTTTWQPFTVTATAPTNAAGAAVEVTNSTAGSPPYTTGVAVTQLQVETATAASTWVQPSPWYSMFTGYVERWPESWTSGGNYGTVDLDVVDYFAFLAQRPILEPFIADLLALDPNFLYPLNEASAATLFADVTGNRVPAQIDLTSASWIKSGTSLQSADNAPPGGDGTDLTGAFLGTAGPAVTTAQGPAVTAGNVRYQLGGAIIVPPGPNGYGPPTSGPWARIIAARAAVGTPTNNALFAWAFEWIGPGNAQGAVVFQLNNFDTSHLNMEGAVLNALYELTFHFPGLPAQVDTSASGLVTDGDWHLYMIGYDPATNTMTLGCDGRVQAGTGSNSAAPSTTARGDAALWIDAIGIDQFSGSQYAWVGDLALACELPFVPTSSQWADLYQSWRNAWGTTSGRAETSDQRYARILGWVGAAGFPQALQAGATVAYGPATDLPGKAALDALQSVVDTEAGQHFIAADGTITFQARNNRYNPTPGVTFGEHTGEVPYQQAVFDFDPTRVANDAQVTAAYGNAVYTAVNTASDDDYGQITIPRTVNSTDDGELQDAADYLMYQNAQPQSRLEQLPVDVGANPAVWGSLLGLDLGACVTVHRRPSNAPAKQLTGFVEQVVWQIGDDRTCTWTGQVSSAALHYFAEFDSTAYGQFDDTLIFGY